LPPGCDVADRPALGHARQRLEAGEDPHRADLWCSGDGTTGEQRPEHPREPNTRLEPGGHGGGHLPNGVVLLDVEPRRHGHRPVGGDPAHIVVDQIDDHQVLCPFLRGDGQARSQSQTLARLPSPRRGPLHRPGSEDPPGRDGRTALVRRSPLRSIRCRCRPPRPLVGPRPGRRRTTGDRP
jgi:hypothetical protein